MLSDEHLDEKAAAAAAERHPDHDRSKPSVHYLNDMSAPEYHDKHFDAETASIATTDDEDELYDWSDDDDLEEEEHKYEEQMGIHRKRTGWGFKRIMTLLFSTLIGSTFLAGILVTPALLIHFYWYEKDPTDERRYVKDNVQAWLFWAAANMMISWYLAMIVDVIPILVTFFISLVWGHVSEYIKSRVELYDSVKNTFKPVLYAASGWASWVIIFAHIFKLYNLDNEETSPAPYLDRVYQVIEFLFFFALVVCLQKMLSHAIAFAFHRTAFKERIDNVAQTLRVIEVLRDYQPKPRSNRASGFNKFGFHTPTLEKTAFDFGVKKRREQRNSREIATDDGHDADGESDKDRTLVSRDKKSKGKKKSTHGFFGKGTSSSRNDQDMELMAGTSRPMTPASTSTPSPHRYPPARAGDETPEVIMQAAKVLKTAVLHDARNIKGEENDNGLSWNVNSASEAKRLARSIYSRLKHPKRSYLLPEDFTPAFQSAEEAQKGFRVFDKDNNGDLSRAEIKDTLVMVYKERRFLSRSMRDVGSALKTLDKILLFFALVVLFFISLSIFGVDIDSSLTSVYSIGIAASFIFKSTASNAFDAIMFLFVTHPYDTGDMCFVDDEIFFVKKMGLFATLFTRVDGTETYYFNSTLSTKFITNVRRSGNMFENLEMQVSWDTPMSKLDELEKMLNEWLATEQNRWFDPSTMIVLQHFDYQRYIELTIGIGHNGTWQDWGLRMARKTAFHAAVQYFCNQLDITCYNATIPVVYADPVTQQYVPEYNDPAGEGEDAAEEVAEEQQQPQSEVKTMLGFKPPASVHTSHMLRARKSRSRKGAARGVAAT
ncbi:Mechanosensitive ion channel-domain-containing protein [Schizophyllum amplum]|uniref:Mechanosensitive ion channel-domain-containing protein n=1 Tax=Schizophyllum amplum TaxID=97359 RepID=A0A550CUM0_9AGAR|nr:Mechanosensitive ion channel-domain-containing protein [Auriculariopsis ampla]